MSHQRLAFPDGRRLAYRLTPGASPGVVFLGGYRSDMTGTKAAFLEAWARGSGRAFLRFDYTGHGASSGRFEDGTVGGWARDAGDAVEALTRGPQLLVGSSMGGWIALLLASRLAGRIAGLVGVAAAPDFTEAIWQALGAEGRERLLRDGRITAPSLYSDVPYVFTRRLIEDGRRHLVLERPLDLPFPVRLLQGSADPEVPVALALRLLAHARCPDLRLTVLKDGGHRLSAPHELALIAETVAAIP